MKKQWLEEEVRSGAVQEPADDWFITDEKVLFDEFPTGFPVAKRKTGRGSI